MIGEVVEQLAVLHDELLEPGAVLGGDWLDQTHVNSVPGSPRGSRGAIHVP
ncbi:MAG: hypothetical protein JWO37_1018 [Acidimicrobiales bacterium]|jgi:hypothetical protein|nr:hypothetical protein [Acidimicrobiales bacterium]